MNYCPSCLSEYESSVARCADCDLNLVSESVIAERPEFHREGEADATTRYVLAGTAEDLFEADAFAAALGEAKLHFWVRPRRASTMGPLTSGANRPWWDLLVPQESLATAVEALAARRIELAEGEAEAEAAAEEEASETTPVTA